MIDAIFKIGLRRQPRPFSAGNFPVQPDAKPPSHGNEQQEKRQEAAADAAKFQPHFRRLRPDIESNQDMANEAVRGIVQRQNANRRGRISGERRQENAAIPGGNGVGDFRWSEPVRQGAPLVYDIYVAG